MDEQRELDQQLGLFDAIMSENSEVEENSHENDTVGDLAPVEQKSRGVITGDDQDLISALNYHALGQAKTRQQHQAQVQLNENDNDSLPVPWTISTSKAAVLPSRKRKSPDPHASTVSPKKVVSPKTKDRVGSLSAVLKPVPGQLSRPSVDPFLRNKARTSRRPLSAGDKFAFLEDTVQAESPKTTSKSKNTARVKPSELEKAKTEPLRSKAYLPVKQPEARKAGRPRKAIVASLDDVNSDGQDSVPVEPVQAIERRSPRQRDLRVDGGANGRSKTAQATQKRQPAVEKSTRPRGKLQQRARPQAAARRNGEQGTIIPSIEASDDETHNSNVLPRAETKRARGTSSIHDLRSGTRRHATTQSAQARADRSAASSSSSGSEYPKEVHQRHTEQTGTRLSDPQIVPDSQPDGETKEVNSLLDGSEGDEQLQEQPNNHESSESVFALDNGTPDGDGAGGETSMERDESRSSEHEEVAVLSYPNHQNEVNEGEDGKGREDKGQSKEANGNGANDVGDEEAKGGNDQGKDDESESDGEEDDESENDNIEFFGGTQSWMKVWDGAKTVGVSNIKGKRLCDIPKLETSTIQYLVKQVKSVRTVYKHKNVLDGAEVDDDLDRQRLDELHAEIQDEIEYLSESESRPTNGTSRSLLIQDIYAHAIPAMVYMLKSAMACRSNLYANVNDTQNLEEIVVIQTTLIQLCEKARRWKAKPETDRPIMGAVTNKVLPYLETLRDRHFAKELTRRRGLESQRLKEENFIASRKRQEEQRKLEKAEHRRAIIERRRLLYEDLQSRPKASMPQFRQNSNDPNPLRADQNGNTNSSSAVPQDRGSVETTGTYHDTSRRARSRSHQHNHSTSAVQWTKEQNSDLIQALLRKDTWNLPGRPLFFFLESPHSGHRANLFVAQQRYLEILNIPSLQNKLPEHIRARALFYKEIVIDEHGPQDFLRGIE